MRVFFLNGPNLNLLGAREPEIYGSATLEDIRTDLENFAATRGCIVEFRQSNHEGVLVDWIQEADRSAEGLVLNPAAYTHTSIAIRDALKAARLAKVELHLSNVHAREAFRRRSHVSPVVDGVICGFGAAGYTLALDAVIGLIDKKRPDLRGGAT